MNPDLEISDFDYELPLELIAQHPAVERTASRLLHLDNKGAIHDRQFTDFPQLLRPGDLLIFNNTRVIKARLTGHKATGGKIEILVERLTGRHTALVHLRSSKPPRAGSKVILEQTVGATVNKRAGELFDLSFDAPVLDVLEQYGSVPLPPYITHTASHDDEQRYQTIYADHPGAVAAPTAGLHFDKTMLDTLKQMGIAQAFVTLHVGAGTFQPVRTDKISDHVMHAERYVVPAQTVSQILAARRAGGRVIAIGTTSARALESAALQARTNHDTAIHDIEGDTQLFITPGYTFNWVDAMLTNFHLPKSTLLMMVSALAGMAPIQHAYAHAVQSRYRFFSYGDAMFIESQ